MVIQTDFYCVFMIATQSEPTLGWVPTCLFPCFGCHLLNKYTGTRLKVFRVWLCDLALVAPGSRCASSEPNGERAPWLRALGLIWQTPASLPCSERVSWSWGGGGAACWHANPNQDVCYVGVCVWIRVWLPPYVPHPRPRDTRTPLRGGGCVFT